MDCDPALAQGCHRCDACRDADRNRACVAAGAAKFLGQVVRRRAGASAAGAAAGRDRLSPASHLRPARPARRVAGRSSRHRLRVPLDRRGARLRRDGVSAPGPPDPSLDRGRRPPPRTGRGDLGRAAVAGVLAGMVLGFAKAIGEFGATITFVSNIPGETQTISSAIYSLIQTPDGDAAALRLVVVSTAIAFAALIASEWFARRATQRLHGN